MSRRDVRILRLAALWTFFIWAVFVRNLLGDETRAVGFKMVHLTLAVVSVAFGVAIWRVATRSGRRARERAGTPS
ncbi:MAG: hypothetical protein ABR540_02185 [Acidimicrobiales bacterium]